MIYYKKVKQILTIFLAILMLASLLAGCARDSEIDQDSDQDGDQGSLTGVSINTSESAVYRSEIIPFPALPDIFTDIGIVILAENVVYFTALGGGEEGIANGFRLFTMDVDGTNFSKLPNYIPGSLPPDAKSGYASINALHIDSEGNLWVSELRGLHDSDLPDGLGESILRKLDKTGAEIAIFDLSSIASLSNLFYVHALNIDDAGYIYIASETSIYILDNQGSLLFSLDNPRYTATFVRLSDGTVALNEWGMQQDIGKYLKRIDTERKSWGEIIRLPQDVAWLFSVFPGIDKYLYLYNDSSHLNGIVAETGELEKVLSWVDSTLSAEDITSVMFLPDGRISITRQPLISTAGAMPVPELLLLIETSIDELPEKELLTLGTFDFNSNVRYVVEQFNRNSDTHRIQVVDYSLFNTDEDSGAGFLRFSIEMITGNAPDILDIRNLPLQNYVSKGLLVDLYPFLDADPELNRSSLIESVLRASEVEGSLYHIVPSFRLATIIGHPSVLGDYPGWSIEEFIDVLDANPQADRPMGFYGTNMSFLQIAILNNINEFVDWSSGTTSFESDDFIGLLERAKALPAELDWDTSSYELIPSGRQIMNIEFFGPSSYLWHLVLFGGEIVFKGFPSENRDGNIFDPSANIAITVNCEDTEAAWEFVRLFLMDDYQRDFIPPWYFPVNRAVFDRMLERAMTPSNMDMSYSDGLVSIKIEIKELSQEQVDKLRSVIDNTTRITNDDDTLRAIVNEGAEDFFNGRFTAQDAARVIQSRVMIYLAEQS